ncbi:dihydroorotate dehydrogenase electron transfer subunit [Oceanobacillus halophilus]|uniref:Dihydroorotate dehydrogenase electron transfer subunit n=1 Tax=Oceanobacillus halophilus TaxID=930130 RepID=A0A494ZTL7_9BACI|nr:dihydroorotate dehydrogenase electron transfer subunit [Oceanobacillus halophilus]RKQ29281.1 dihydroorotate dehydrogenase electron transfer subunit [Oceanobacillus halophilus]
MQAQEYKVLSNTQVSDRYWLMVVDASNMTQTVQPGQFFHIKTYDGIYPLLRRPLSVYKIDAEHGQIEFLYLVKGLGTNKMTELQAGETIDLFGPLGKGFDVNAGYDSILLLARGVGVATLSALAYEAAASGKQVTAILSARSRNDLLAADYLRGIGVDVYKVTEEDGNSDVDQVEELIHDILSQTPVDALYTCGSKRLSRLMQKIAKQENLPGEIALEEHMGCGMGVCYACVCEIQTGDEVKNARVCVDGPVFPLEQVVIK